MCPGAGRCSAHRSKAVRAWLAGREGQVGPYFLTSGSSIAGRAGPASCTGASAADASAGASTGDLHDLPAGIRCYMDNLYWCFNSGIFRERARRDASGASRSLGRPCRIKSEGSGGLLQAIDRRLA